MKKRMTILVEDHVYPDGTVFEPGSIELGEERIPITWNFNTDVKNLLGTADDFYRSPEGNLSMVMTFERKDITEELLKSLEARVYVHQIVDERVGNKKIIHSGLLRMIGMVLADDAWKHPETEEETHD